MRVLLLLLVAVRSAAAQPDAAQPDAAQSDPEAPSWAARMAALAEAADRLAEANGRLDAAEGRPSDSLALRHATLDARRALDALNGEPAVVGYARYDALRDRVLGGYLDLFGETPPEAVVLAPLRPPTPPLLQAPPEHAPAIAEHRARFGGRHTQRYRRRAAALFPMMERVFREHGLPPELKYVAVVESGLDAQAVSPLGSRGLWQFRPATAQHFGLEDPHAPEAATRAAARYLSRLLRQFGGDAQLALAAYNCGPARVRKALAAARARLDRHPTYWDIRPDLPPTTRDYVPKVIAAAHALDPASRPE